jgi:hypothetical protein
VFRARGMESISDRTEEGYGVVGLVPVSSLMVQ